MMTRKRGRGIAAPSLWWPVVIIHEGSTTNYLVYSMALY
jgi:hypothetical protein